MPDTSAVAAPGAALGVPLHAAWNTFADATLHAAWLVRCEPAPRILAANAAAAALARLDAGALAGRPVLDLLGSPEDDAFWHEAAAGGARIESDTVLCRGDGVLVPVRRRVRPLPMPGIAGAAGGALYVVALQDLSAQQDAQRALELGLAELQATLESTHDGILVIDLAGRIRNFNRRFAALWAIPPELLARGQDGAVLDWMRERAADPAAYARRLAAIETGTVTHAADVVQLSSGQVFERVVTPQFHQGRPIGRVFAFRDVTEKLQARERIQLLSCTDALTGLPNRQLLADRVGHALAHARREGAPFAFLLLNLDRFSHVNETLGHALADRVLLDVAERLKSCVREGDTVARLGADEFAILVQQADEAGAEAAATRVAEALRRPFAQGDLRFTVTASIGIAMHPGDADSLDDLERCAAGAMREAKDAGRANFRFHRPRRGPPGGAPSRSRMRLDHAMRQALAHGNFRLHYQPQLEVDGGRIVGAEALVRWRDPELGDVSPGEFIPVAEESGFIVAIDEWVLREAVRQAAAWHADGLGLVMSVNLSALQFKQPGFVDRVASVLREFGLPPRWLELELTESILIQDADEAMLKLQSLARLGVKLAIDDFGTGYSSLGYLKRFPIGRLKIDRSFVGGLPDAQSDAAIVRAVVDMARALHLDVVAEGVENEAQLRFLQRCGCAHFQGFLAAPALEPAVFERMVQARRGAQAQTA